MAVEVCPNCGAVVPHNAKACPECSADEKTGWSDSAYAGNLGIPEDNFDYDQFVREEFGGKKVKPRNLHWVWWITALVLALLFLFCFFQ